MCLACHMVSCASDEFQGCGCVHCDEPDCWDDPDEVREDVPDDDSDGDGYDLRRLPLAARRRPAPSRFRCVEIA
ncbi:hypothetical protein [Methylobacterium soli]|uniref:hypothetical protein n=1 Tax=Methylobacterium soli TaxID=553447 RepID=UPI00178170E8|nr:hypothetical protein [Methylobacterium soli]GJE41318.1 hypothetical protein AEGHOMDF_0482 [Methylobacterium soli]